MTDAATAAMTGVASGSGNQYGLQNLSNQEIQMMLAQLAPMSVGGDAHLGPPPDQQHQHVLPNDITNGSSALNLNPTLLGINPGMGYSSADVQKIMQKLSATFGTSGFNNSGQ
ncbi:hypothetical protein GGI22_007921 [Coemansia erecta]|nr:hypothetical protein GGI22_007921 [Coemansia erecta]